MAVTCGFFNSVSGDRLYNAGQMSEYFRGLVSDGVFADVGNGLQVVAGSGMAVNVSPGRCLIDSRWMANDNAFTVSISAASSTLNRWTAIVARLDYTAREITIEAKDGTPAATPTKPEITRSETVKELCLAMIYVAKGATSIAQTVITDTRADTDICGWVTGLIEQVDTSELFRQWQAAYSEFYASFQSWFDTLTSQLQVNTYISSYEKTETGAPEDLREIALDMPGYTYDAADVLNVFINGLRAGAGDWSVDNGILTISSDALGGSRSTNAVTVQALKSKIGDPVSGGSYFRAMQITEQDAATSTITVTENN